MSKNLFETKVKDGLWVLAVVLVIMATSLMLDSVQGYFRPGKIAVDLYIPSWDVGSDGPSLREGDAVKLYKMVVGRVTGVDIFVARVLKPAWSDGGEKAEGATGPRKSQEVLVSGLKVRAELFWNDFGPGLAMVTADSRVKVESQPLGDSAVVLYVSDRGTSIGSGSRINFPRHDQSVLPADVKDQDRFGEELTDPTRVSQLMKTIAEATEPAPKSGTSSFFEETEDDF